MSDLSELFYSLPDSVHLAEHLKPSTLGEIYSDLMDFANGSCTTAGDFADLPKILRYAEVVKAAGVAACGAKDFELHVEGRWAQTEGKNLPLAQVVK